MNWQFTDLQNMKDFASHLAKELNSIGENNWSKEIDFYSTNTYTTQTEYLGEFRIALKQLLQEKEPLLKKDLVADIKLAIEAINKAFGTN